jgi:hypothetical protein
MTDRARQIHILAQNSSTAFEHTFGRPADVLDFLKGWLQSPDRPYELTVSEEAKRTGKVGVHAATARGRKP